MLPSIRELDELFLLVKYPFLLSRIYLFIDHPLRPPHPEQSLYLNTNIKDKQTCSHVQSGLFPTWKNTSTSRKSKDYYWHLKMRYICLALHDYVMIRNLPYLSGACFYHIHLCSFCNWGISFSQLGLPHNFHWYGSAGKEIIFSGCFFFCKNIIELILTASK